MSDIEETLKREKKKLDAAKAAVPGKLTLYLACKTLNKATTATDIAIHCPSEKTAYETA